MSLTKKTCLIAGLVALLAVAGVVRGQPSPAPSRSEFMKKKLEYSKKVLEGLTLEDYDTISKNAKALKLLSQAAEWQVRTIPNAADYVSFTNEFQRLADELAQKAKDKNLDGATLTYLRLTMNCVNCHKYVRGLSH